MTIAVVGATDIVLETCDDALSELGAVVAIAADGGTGKLLDAPPRIDVIVLHVAPPLTAGVAFFERCRKANPVPPLVLVAQDVAADLAVELLLFGADDIALLPVEPSVLGRKVERALGRFVGPAIDAPELVPLRPWDGPSEGEERRRCFRAKIPLWHPMTARAVERWGEFNLVVVDLSIPTEGWPGGMLLSAPPETARELPFARWAVDERVAIRVDLPDRGSPIELECRPVAGLRLGARRCVDFAVQYKARNAAEAGRIRRYWAEVQRRHRRP